MDIEEWGRDKWWLGVVLGVCALPVNVAGGLTIGLIGVAPGGGAGFATKILWVVVFTALVGASVAVYFDRQYVSSVSEWTPTRLYYFMFLGYIGMFLAVLYVWRRHRVLGVP